MNQRLLAALIGRMFMAPAGEGGGGGGGGTVDVAAAREFVTGFVPDPKLLEGMDDTTVVAWHGQLNKQIGTHVEKANQSRDWRKEIAGDDPEAMKTLERFQSQKALYDSYNQFRTKQSKGELKAVTPFPDKGTPEQQTQWRTENGIPESPDKYEFKVADKTGAPIAVGEADKPVLESFAKYAHAKNLPASMVNEAASWWFQERAERTEAARAGFEQQKTETAATLGQEWGPDYKSNLNKIQGVIDSTIPAGEDGDQLKTLINNAIATNPHFARHYAAMALQLNPTGTIVPGGPGANESSVADGIKRIEAVMKKDRAAYDKDEGMQKEYLALLGHYQKLTGKEWGRT